MVKAIFIFYRTNSIHMTTSVLPRLNILCIKLPILYVNAFHPGKYEGSHYTRMRETRA